MAGATSLHELAKQGDLEGLTVALIKQQGNVNKKDKLGRTPLIMAAFAGHVDCLKLLVAEGAQVHITAQDDMTALHFAASKGHTEAVRFLLDSGIKSNRKTTRHGNTALHLAAKAGHVKTVQLLVRRKGNSAQPNSKGETPMDLANNPEVKAVLQQAVANAEEAAQASGKNKEAKEGAAEAAAGGIQDTAQLDGGHSNGQGATEATCHPPEEAAPPAALSNAGAQAAACETVAKCSDASAAQAAADGEQSLQRGTAAAPGAEDEAEGATQREARNVRFRNRDAGTGSKEGGTGVLQDPVEEQPSAKKPKVVIAYDDE